MAELNTILSPTLFGKKLIQLRPDIVGTNGNTSIEEIDCGTFIGYDGECYITLDNENILRRHYYRYNGWKFV